MLFKCLNHLKLYEAHNLYSLLDLLIFETNSKMMPLGKLFVRLTIIRFN